MQLALRPYVTAEIALVGASVIAVTPVAPPSTVHMPAVNLTASIDNPIQVFAPVVDAAGSWITRTIQSEIANPFPILQQIATNQITTAAGVLQAVQAGAKGVGELAAGLPAALQAAGAKLAVGDVNGAIDAIISSGLNPILGMITGVWTPMQAVLQRPFQVGTALVPALFDAALSLTLAAMLSTVGIGFDTGTTPFIQQIVKSTQSVLTAVTTLNPINVLNAIQHGFADVTLNLITQLDAFTTGTIPFIRDTIVRALQAPNPVTALSVAVAAAPETAAAELTAPATGTESPTVSTDGTAGTVTEVATETEPTQTSVPGTAAEESTAVDTLPVADTIVTAPETETVTAAVTTTEAPAKETAASETDTTVTKGSTTVTRDSLKAEPGKSGLTSGTDSGSATKTETTDTKPASETKDTASATTGGASTSASSDSGSGSDSGSSDSA
ncbi:hypothetical protein [Mycolicibacterium sp. 624]|uniref:hypothetical protein n=1 Tax=Mycolicibacterium sp. 624 TaxID=3156314 RepID=UPI003399D6D9